MKHVTIKALAKELNLSVSTISKALRDSYEISDDTKQRVLETAARLNYTPHPYASSLRGRQSRNIGVVIPEVADSFFSLAINGIESVVKEKGYHVLIYLTHEQFANEAAILQEFQGGRVDGVLLSVSRETTSAKHIDALIVKDIPVVFFDRALEDVAADRIVTDDMESGYNAAAHLIKNGCRHIAYLAISEKLGISNQRMEGYKQALKDHGLAFRKSDVVSCSGDAAQHLRVIKKILQQKQRPDGVIASVEKLAMPVYQACRDLKLSIPKDVKVICFSNLEIATILHPSLTTITQPAFEIGQMAATVLLKALSKKGGTDIQEVVIPSALVARASTKS